MAYTLSRSLRSDKRSTYKRQIVKLKVATLGILVNPQGGPTTWLRSLYVVGNTGLFAKANFRRGLCLRESVFGQK